MFENIKSKAKFRHEMRKIADEARRNKRKAMVQFMKETDPKLAKSYAALMKFYATREAMARKAMREA